MTCATCPVTVIHGTSATSLDWTPHRPPDHEYIIEEVAKYYNLEEYQIYVKTRQRPMVTARQIAMYLIKKHTTLNDRQIGQIFNLDRTTAIHSRQVVVPALINTDENFARDIAYLETLM